MTLLVPLILWLLVQPFLYGYHISALNQIHAALTCHYDGPPLPPTGSKLPECIPMTDFAFGLVTSIFTIGGLVGSLCANRVMDSRGRVDASRISSILVIVGGIIISVSGGVPSFAIGRFIIGIGAGIGLCVAPVFLAEISPHRLKSNLGVLTQLSVVIGIFVTQLIGMRFAIPLMWRLVFHCSSAVAVIQLIVSVFLPDTPPWLRSRGLNDQAESVAISLWGPDHEAEYPKRVSDLTHESRAPLLDSPDDRESARPQPSTPPPVSVIQLLSVPDYRRPLITVSLAMLSQQFSGVNAVLYYSNAILSKALPELGPHISLAITVVNVVMTFPAIFLIERTGRRRLFQFSALGAIASLLCVGIGLDTNKVMLASVAILTFIMSFAVGLGPVPFVLIPEVSPAHAVSAISSVTLAINWLSNFTVGLMFLPLRHALSGGDPYKEGRVFYLFAALLSLGLFSLGRFYRG